MSKCENSKLTRSDLTDNKQGERDDMREKSPSSKHVLRNIKEIEKGQ